MGTAAAAGVTRKWSPQGVRLGNALRPHGRARNGGPTISRDEWTHLPGDSRQQTRSRPRLPADARVRAPVPDRSPPTSTGRSASLPCQQARAGMPALAWRARTASGRSLPLSELLPLSDSFGDVFDSQLDLVALARTAERFQWIDSSHGLLRRSAGSLPRRRVRAEPWLSSPEAHTRSATSEHWNLDVGAEIARNRTHHHEYPVPSPRSLVDPRLRRASLRKCVVRSGAREHNGAVYSSP